MFSFILSVNVDKYLDYGYRFINFCSLIHLIPPHKPRNLQSNALSQHQTKDFRLRRKSHQLYTFSSPINKSSYNSPSIQSEPSFF